MWNIKLMRSLEEEVHVAGSMPILQSYVPQGVKTQYIQDAESTV